MSRGFQYSYLVFFLVVIVHFPFNYFSFFLSSSFHLYICSDAPRIVFIKFIFITHFPVCFEFGSIFYLTFYILEWGRYIEIYDSFSFHLKMSMIIKSRWLRVCVCVFWESRRIKQYMHFFLFTLASKRMTNNKCCCRWCADACMFHSIPHFISSCLLDGSFSNLPATHKRDRWKNFSHFVWVAG